jgi:hypothetical protein
VFATTSILAFVAAADRDYTRVFVWSLALMGLVIAGLVVVSKVKKRMQQSDQPVSAGFTLSDLRQLHKSGQMSDEEFERAKAKVIEAAKRAAERDAARTAGAAGAAGAPRTAGAAARTRRVRPPGAQGGAQTGDSSEQPDTGPEDRT